MAIIPQLVEPTAPVTVADLLEQETDRWLQYVPISGYRRDDGDSYAYQFVLTSHRELLGNDGPSPEDCEEVCRRYQAAGWSKVCLFPVSPGVGSTMFIQLTKAKA